ncbi:MAG: molybdopterin-binding protein [Nitrososphaerales archaeon]
MKRSAEIICVGNELLTGHTLNTNAHWLAGEITRIGGIVRKIIVVGDETEEIAASIKESLGRKGAWIIISGGLGPTYDDKTLLGLARALGLKLVVNKEAVTMLKHKYVKTSIPTLSPSRYKMATIPANSKPLENPVGHAPGVMVKYGSCMIFALPGVPQEMRDIFSMHVLPVLKQRIGKFVRTQSSFETRGVMESILAPYLEIVVARNPNVYVKSHPKGYNKGVPTLHIDITAEGSNRNTANRYLRRAVRQMKHCIKRTGGTVK